MKPDLILSADWHLREDQPECRTDNYWEAQTRAVDYVRQICEKFDCPLCIAGDLFDGWNPSHYLTGWTLRNLPRVPIYTVAGQHDLRNHRISSLPKTGLNVLESAGRVIVLREGRSLGIGDSTALYGFSFGEDLRGRSTRAGFSGKRAVLVHKLTWYKKKPFPQIESKDSASLLLDRLHGFNLILVGDNHQPFVVRRKKQVLVNPGSLLRMRADQMEHRPRVYLWEAKLNRVSVVYLPIEEGVITRKHIEKKEKSNKRLRSFIKRLSRQGEIGLSFRDNLQKFFRKQKTKKAVKQLIQEAMEK